METIYLDIVGAARAGTHFGGPALPEFHHLGLGADGAVRHAKEETGYDRQRGRSRSLHLEGEGGQAYPPDEERSGGGVGIVYPCAGDVQLYDAGGGGADGDGHGVFPAHLSQPKLYLVGFPEQIGVELEFSGILALDFDLSAPKAAVSGDLGSLPAGLLRGFPLLVPGGDIELEGAQLLKMGVKKGLFGLLIQGRHRGDDIENALVGHGTLHCEGEVFIMDGIDGVVHILLGGGGISLEKEGEHVPVFAGRQRTAGDGHRRRCRGESQTQFLLYIDLPFSRVGIQRGVDPVFYAPGADCWSRSRSTCLPPQLIHAVHPPTLLSSRSVSVSVWPGEAAPWPPGR